MTNTLARLETSGLIAIRADESDGRKKRVSITAEGLKVRQAATSAIRPVLEAMRDEIAVEEFVAALPFLIRLRSWLDQHR
jgi:DNA-binding MarR family transcriptional regulator